MDKILYIIAMPIVAILISIEYFLCKIFNVSIFYDSSTQYIAANR
mgnify:CR=1 FL=1